MSDSKKYCCCSSRRDNVVLDVNRVMDSCKDKDCFSDTTVILGENGREIIEKTSNIRVKSTETVWTSLDVQKVRFNDGFYSVNVRFFVKIIFEACLCGCKETEFEGLAICDKKVILYGGEGNVNVFRSGENNSFCSCKPSSESKIRSMPFAICEVTDPIALDVRTEIRNKCDFSGCTEIPECVINSFDCRFCERCSGDEKELLVTLGFFSVIRLEREGQYMVNAQESCVPEKNCCFEEADPCTVFKQMEFPTDEFCTSKYKNS